MSNEWGVYTCTARAVRLEEAVTRAKEQANAWLVRHAWMDANGHCATDIQTQAIRDGDEWVYVMHLIGNQRETA